MVLWNQFWKILKNNSFADTINCGRLIFILVSFDWFWFEFSPNNIRDIINAATDFWGIQVCGNLFIQYSSLSYEESYSYYECIYDILGGDNEWVDNTHYTRREEIYSSITWWKSFSSGELSDFDRTWSRQSEVDCGKCRQVLRSMWEKGGLSSKLKNWTFQLKRTHV